jgi:hypothetical protein
MGEKDGGEYHWSSPVKGRVAREAELSLLGGNDVSSHIVSFYPPEKQALDFGHVDLFYAEHAQKLIGKW